MVAALQTLRAQKICDLIGALRQRRKGQPGLAAITGIDDPERRAVLAFGLARKSRVEPVERPVERDGVGPTKLGEGLLVVRPVLQQKCARLLEGGHCLCPCRQVCL